MSEVKNVLDIYNKYKETIDYVCEHNEYGNLNITKEEFLEVAPFLRIGGTVKQFIYKHRDDKEFIKATSKYHRNAHYFKNDIELYENILGTTDVEPLVDGFRNADAMYLYLLKTDNKDHTMFMKNWLFNEHIDSFSMYLSLNTSLNNKQKLNYSRNNYFDNGTGRRIYAYYLLTEYVESNSSSKDDLRRIIDVMSLEFGVNPSDDLKESLKELREASDILNKMPNSLFLKALNWFSKN